MIRGSNREERRDDALSRDRIVEAAIALLDAQGEDGLTFRALATRLATGAGAIFESTGRAVEALGVSGHSRFTATATLVSYIIGVSVQNSAASQFAQRELAPTTNRADFLEATAERWKQLDATEYPFTRKVAAELPGHDDRKEYLAGIDMILRGISAC